MPYLDNHIYDNGLSALAGANVLHICSSEPASYGAVAGASSGTKSAPSIGAPSARTGGGRKVTVAAITGGNVADTETATHWALVDTVNSRLLAAGALAAGQLVTSGNTFTLTSFDIGIPGA